jgi:type I restriction enzyme R subunit
VARKYSRDPANAPASALRFDPVLVPRPLSAHERMQRQAELVERERSNAERDRQLPGQRGANEALPSELTEFRKQVMVREGGQRLPSR